MKKEKKLLNRLLKCLKVMYPIQIHLNSFITDRLQELPWLTTNLAGGGGAYFVRFLFYKMTISERHLTAARLENKFLQYLVLNHFLPGYLPHTINLTKLFYREDGEQKIYNLVNKGYFLKATLGDGSFRTKSFDRTKELSDVLTSSILRYDLEDRWILQKKLSIDKEYRVHTFGKEPIYGLTFNIQGLDTLDARFGAEAFIVEVLDRIPDYILHSSLIGWDIALSHEGRWYLIESNITGFHQVYKPGFQTTGYVEYNDFGPPFCAWLNLFFKMKFNIFIDNISKNLLEQFKFYQDFLSYNLLFNEKHYNRMKYKKHSDLVVTIVYLFENITYGIKATLISYLQAIGFCEHYEVIYSEEYEEDVINLFGKNPQINVTIDSSLFSDDGYHTFIQMVPEQRSELAAKELVQGRGITDYIIF